MKPEDALNEFAADLDKIAVQFKRAGLDREVGILQFASGMARDKAVYVEKLEARK